MLLTGLIGSSPVTEQRDPLKERVKEHRVRRFHSSGDATRRPISCKLNNRDASITQFAVIDDDNVSALQQVTRGGGGKSFACSGFLNVKGYCFQTNLLALKAQMVINQDRLGKENPTEALLLLSLFILCSFHTYYIYQHIRQEFFLLLYLMNWGSPTNHAENETSSVSVFSGIEYCELGSCYMQVHLTH